MGILWAHKGAMGCLVLSFFFMGPKELISLNGHISRLSKEHSMQNETIHMYVL